MVTNLFRLDGDQFVSTVESILHLYRKYPSLRLCTRETPVHQEVMTHSTCPRCFFQEDGQNEEWEDWEEDGEEDRTKSLFSGANSPLASHLQSCHPCSRQTCGGGGVWREPDPMICNRRKGCNATALYSGVQARHEDALVSCRRCAADTG